MTWTGSDVACQAVSFVPLEGVCRCSEADSPARLRRLVLECFLLLRNVLRQEQLTHDDLDSGTLMSR